MGINLNIDLSQIRNELRTSLANIKLGSKEAKPTSEDGSQRQCVITKTCKTCLNNCKIKVDSECYQNAYVNCKDYKAKPIKISL